MNAYHAAHNGVVLVDLNACGRLELSDRDRLSLIHRMSTNDVLALAEGQGAATVLTTPIGRIIDLITVFQAGEKVYVITSPERGETIFNYFRRNIFFNDRVKVHLHESHLYGLYGSRAAKMLENFGVGKLGLYDFVIYEETLIARVKPLAGGGFWLMGMPDALENLTHRLLGWGAEIADAETMELLRIEAGYPAVELSDEYIPLEVGLWDSVSFNKGCYTGQEIIARMESRGKLAKMMVRLSLNDPLPAQTPLYLEGEPVGKLTSIARQPSGGYLALGFVKPVAVSDNAVLTSDTGVQLKILGIAGAQPGR
ncbi:MAG: glycine cleavage system protein T [Anaerolineae bacterium]|nr:glycine cleavage system protein T [Anaerolineae bacterium]